jgi:hypothetical protein
MCRRSNRPWFLLGSYDAMDGRPQRPHGVLIDGFPFSRVVIIPRGSWMVCSLSAAGRLDEQRQTQWPSMSGLTDISKGT